MQRTIIGTLAVIGLALGTSGAYAATNNACPSGAPNTVTVSPDAKSYSALFDAFQVLPGDIGTCTFAFPLTNVPAGVVSVYATDYRGEVDLDPGETAKLTIKHNGQSADTDFTDPGPGAGTLYSDVVASNGGKISSTANLDLSGDDPAGFSLGAIDTIDYAEIGRITLPGDETAIVTHLSATGDLLTGGNKPTEGDNELGLIGGVGSAMFGVTGRYNISEGFSILGGVSLVSQSTNLGTPYTGVLGAAAVRYVEPGTNSFRLFGEGGAQLAGLRATFTPATGATASGNLGVGTLYGRGGVLINPDENNEITLSATLAESDFGVSAFSMSSGPFAATVGTQQGFFTTIKGTAQWTAKLAPTVDFTATASLGTVIATTPVAVAVTGLGTINSTPPGTVFAEYGARLGWTPVDNLTLDGFVWGSTGTNVGSHNMIGAQARWRF